MEAKSWAGGLDLDWYKLIERAIEVTETSFPTFKCRHAPEESLGNFAASWTTFEVPTVILRQSSMIKNHPHPGHHSYLRSPT